MIYEKGWRKYKKLQFFCIFQENIQKQLSVFYIFGTNRSYKDLNWSKWRKPNPSTTYLSEGFISQICWCKNFESIVVDIVEIPAKEQKTPEVNEAKHKEIENLLKFDV